MTFLKPTVREFVDTMIVQTWQRYRKGIIRELNSLEKTKQALGREWEGT
jgi:hypothetical protein